MYCLFWCLGFSGFAILAFGCFFCILGLLPGGLVFVDLDVWGLISVSIVLMVECVWVSLVVLVTFGVSECLFVWVVRKVCWLVTCGIWLFRGFSGWWFVSLVDVSCVSLGD